MGKFILLDQQLIDAVKNKGVSEIRSLLNEGASPNAYLPPTDAVAFLTSRYEEEIVEQLLKHEKDKNKVTIWHIIVESGDEEIVKLFLERGADINARDNSNTVALYIATARIHKKIIKLLLEKGASTDVQDNLGETVLDLVIKK